MRNLAAALFRLERGRTASEILEVVDALLEWLKQPEQASLRRAFAVWLDRVILARSPEGRAGSGIEDLREMRMTLAERFHDWLEEGRQEGLREGLDRGVHKGQAQLLERQLRRRFGELPEQVVQRLEQAAPEQLERWGERIFDAGNLNELFQEE
jgi:hypothetical protein